MRARWHSGLRGCLAARGAVAVLLDTNRDRAMADNLRRTIKTDGDRVADLDLWLLGAGRLGALVTPSERAEADYRATLARFVARASDDRGQARRMTGGERTRKKAASEGGLSLPHCRAQAAMAAALRFLR